MNRLRLSGLLTQRDVLRYTPSGIAAVNFELSHESEIEEAASKRKVQLIISAVAFAEVAFKIDAHPLNTTLELEGFLASRSLTSKHLQFHVTQLIQEV